VKANPVLHEGLQVYWIEGHAFVPYACVLALLAPIEFLTLFLPSLDPQAWMGPANLFKASSIAALILIIASRFLPGGTGTLTTGNFVAAIAAGLGGALGMIIIKRTGGIGR